MPNVTTDELSAITIENYPGASIAVLSKIISTIYIDFLDGNEEISEKFKSHLEIDVIKSFRSSQNNRRITVKFRPKMTVELVNISGLIDEKESQLVEYSIERMMAMMTSKNKKLRIF